jgi:AcrR family transcriptional regulator
MPDATAVAPRDRFIAAAEVMLRETGMSGAGIKEVAARSAAPIGSLYHYFPGGKAQLVGEAIRRHAAKLPRIVARSFDGKKSAAAGVRTLFADAADGFERAGADKGCAIGAVALDLTRADAEIREICREAFGAWVEDVAARLPVSGERARRSLAVTIVGAIEGAFVLARASGNGQPFRDAGRWLTVLVESVEAKHRPRRTGTRTGSRPRPRSKP